MNGARTRFGVGFFAAVALTASAVAGVPPSLRAPARDPGSGLDAPAVQRQLMGLEVPFEANAGQDDARVAFTARTLGGTLFVTRDGQLAYSFPGKAMGTHDRTAGHDAASPRRGRGWALTETLVGARPVPRGGGASSTRVSRFIGSDPARWRSDVATHDRVLLGEAWPGIAVELAARGNNVEKLFTVAPGADARRIAIRLKGAQRLELSADGALVAHTGNGPVTFTAPVAWQDVAGERRPVAVAYALKGQRYGFTLGDYDRAHAVVIDPLVQATYLGGRDQDVANALAVDASGNVHAAGWTASSNFPGTAGGAQAANSGSNWDGFVATLSPDLTRLIQATYLGGDGLDSIEGIAVDASGNVFVAGFTGSTNLPKTAGGAQATYGGGYWDAFVARLNPDLTVLAQATYLGGTGYEGAYALALDASGNALVTGYTLSTDFPGTAGGAASTSRGTDEVFVAKLDPSLATLIQATYLGGSSRDQANALAVDASGAVFVAGKTYSPDFPKTTGGAQPAIAVHGGDWDAFVAKLDGGLISLIQSTFLGGRDADIALALAMAKSGDVLVAGTTGSADFPKTAGGAQAAHGLDNGADDVFVARLNSGLTTLLQATYLGGNGSDLVNGGAMAVDATGMVHVAGSTASSDFPQPAGAAPAVRAGAWDGFVATLNPGLTTLSRTRFLGGSKDTRANGIAVDASGNVFVAGQTYATDLPRTAGSAQSAHAYNTDSEDAFVAKFGATSYQGMWWNAPALSESGWGINFAHQGDTIFATWFTFGLDGKPLWVVVAATKTAPGVYAGKLFTGTGPPFSAVPFDPNLVAPVEVGTATFTFADDDNATFAYTLYGVAQTKQITREVFGNPIPACALGVPAGAPPVTNFQDMWWAAPAGIESGWGINFAHQGDTIFATWFTFGADGKPLWLVAALLRTGPNVYAGAVYSGTGPPFNAVPFNPAQVIPVQVGTATVTFTDGSNASFAYDVYGVAQAKPITREVFDAPASFCE